MPTPAGGGSLGALSPAYATATDWIDLVGTAPANAGRLLYLATLDVDRALTSSLYDTTDAVIVDALRRATVEQAAWRIANGYTEGIVHNRIPNRVAIGSAMVDYRSPGASAEPAGGVELADAARAILMRAGMLAGNPITEVWYW